MALRLIKSFTHKNVNIVTYDCSKWQFLITVRFCQGIKWYDKFWNVLESLDLSLDVLVLILTLLLMFYDTLYKCHVFFSWALISSSEINLSLSPLHTQCYFRLALLTGLLTTKSLTNTEYYKNANIIVIKLSMAPYQLQNKTANTFAFCWYIYITFYKPFFCHIITQENIYSLRNDLL